LNGFWEAVKGVWEYEVRTFEEAVTVKRLCYFERNIRFGNKEGTDDNSRS
jgi:hypothetical protein